MAIESRRCMDTQQRFRDIESLCRQLEVHMKSLPGLRLGQFLTNALMASQIPCSPEELHLRLFYIRDEELMDFLSTYLKEYFDESSISR